MSPLLAEYIKRRNSPKRSTARGANKLMSACIHEAGHWMVFAHFKMKVDCAFVDRRPNGSGGYVESADFSRYTHEAEYITTLAGAGAECMLIPFIDYEYIRANSKGDGSSARQLFIRMFGGNRDARKSFRERFVPFTENLIRLNWPTVEALAYELMTGGKFIAGECRKVERRYGIGRDAPTTPGRLKLAKQKLAVFHSSPGELLQALNSLSTKPFGALP